MEHHRAQLRLKQGELAPVAFDTEWWQHDGLSLAEAEAIVDREEEMGEGSTGKSSSSSSSLSTSSPVAVALSEFSNISSTSSRIKKLMKRPAPLVATIAMSIAAPFDQDGNPALFLSSLPLFIIGEHLRC